jgi:tRNA1(Val) A37 N6-methylase TrmN6
MRVEAYTFVDVGAGKGRALLLASELAFRRVIGVELNEDLALIAQRNIAAWSRITHPRGKIRVMHRDAANFRWPRAPLLVYLNNPFDCDLVEQLADQIVASAQSGPGLVDILSVNPGCAEMLIRQGNFKLLWNEQIRMDDADQSADPYGAASDRVSGFRFRAGGRIRTVPQQN